MADYTKTRIATRKEYLRHLAESDAKFKQLWKMEDKDNVPSTRTIRKGRFLITVCDEPKKEEESNPTVTKRGRFLVTKYYVPQVKQPIKTTKPTVVRKGRFKITVY